MTTRTYDPARGRWIPWVFTGMMLLVVGVNGVLITAAVQSFTGTTTGRSYDRGRAYNHILEEAARQAALGWTPRVTLAEGRLEVAVTDHDGLPVEGRLEGLLRRPIEGTSLPIEPERSGPGRWSAPVALPAPGQWEARLTLTDAAGRHLDIRQRVIAP
ncbi:FixH family protein [Belnapia sp. T6]|uniref:FixH family protein n=1 Tax=Belnapia mucosa TaxID=2804532 RepID=A0ABS1V778_9PROT|nr:FixH family protein [Belnapia mucosa]MBL6457518.1 FixH family protein [Belnapia mucosa]